MKDGDLFIDGKTYISSIRAAQLVGYTKDYVGQLARAGKIDCKLIGRNWYVSEESITKHKLGVHYTLTKPKKPRKYTNDDEYSFHEKHNNYIGISPIVDIEKSPVSYAEISLHKGNVVGHDDGTLYPELRKQQTHDPLLNTDIRYEYGLTGDDEKQHVVTDDLVNVDDTSTQDASDTNAVPIRNMQPAHERQNVQYPRMIDRFDTNTHTSILNDQGTCVDGIRPVVQAVHDVRMYRTRKQTETVSRVFGDNKNHTNESRHREHSSYRTHDQMHDDRESSRALPIVAALLAFVIFSVFYTLI